MSALCMARFEPLTLSELPSGIWRTRLRVRFGCVPSMNDSLEVEVLCLA
ncbi:hypothetical protein V1288_001082 [Bradyrhizobium sp. AZCC 2176]